MQREEEKRSEVPRLPVDGATVQFFCSPLAPEENGEKYEARRNGHHFLEACYLCKLLLRCNQDIFMCRGNIPFCSEECRQEWMYNMEEAREVEENADYGNISAKATEVPPEEEQTAARKASRVFHIPPLETVVAG